MRTPWGDLEVCDAHVHFFSLGFFFALATESGRAFGDIGATLKWDLPASVEDLVGAWRAELDRHGVKRAALIASVPGDEGSVAAAAGPYADRFWGYFMANPLAPDGIERVQRGLAGGRLRGVCLFPAMHRYSINDAHVRPVFEAAAAQSGTAVFVHCGVLTVGVRAKLGLASRFDMRFSNPIDLHAVALEFPQVNFVIPHFGAGYFREALMVCDLCPNVYLDTSSSNTWVKYLAEGLTLKDVFRRALDVAGPRRLLFGTDSSFFPRGWQAAVFRQQVEVLDELGISAEHAGWILGGNLKRILGTEEPG